MCVDVIGGRPRGVDEGGRQVCQFGEVTADIAAVGVDLVRTVGIAARWLCLGRQGRQLAWLSAGSVPVWTEAVHADALVGVEVEGVAEIVGAQLLENRM